MKYTKTILSTVTVAFLATGCVKPATEQQAVYSGQEQSQQQAAYEEPTSTGYETQDTGMISNSGVIYNDIPSDQTVITPTTGGYDTQVGSTQQAVYDSTGINTQPETTQSVYNNPAVNTQPVYTNPYETSSAEASYPDPYANSGASTTNSYPSYPAVSRPAPTYHPSTPAPATSSHGGGIQLQIAALKDYYAAEEFKRTLSLAPGQSAYIKRGAINKVIVTGISSVSEANRLKESRFPGAFIVSGGSSYGSYSSAPAQTSSSSYGDYSVNDPYGSSSSSASAGGIGVQIGAFSTRSKAQSVANSHSGQHSAVVKRVNGLYKVIITGFTSRSSAKRYATQVGGFVVSSY